MQPDLLSFLVLLLIISMFLNLFFINSKLLNKKRSKNIENQTPEIVKKFLSSQAYKTSNSHKFHYIPDLNGMVAKFRTAYLKIEEKCIDRKIDSREYWNLLNAKLTELLNLAANFMGNKPMLNIKKKVDLIKRLVKDSKAGGDKNKIYSCLDRFYEVCDSNSNEKKIEEYDKKLNKIIMRFTDKYYAKMDRLVNVNNDYVESGQDAIKGLESSTSNMERIAEGLDTVRGPAKEALEKCKLNNKHIKEGVDNVKNSLYQLEQKVFKIKGADEADVLGEKANHSSNELSELSEMIQAENEKEIARLRSVINNQKEVIFDLEEKIRAMIAELEAENAADIPPEEKEKNQALIDSLRANLRDAEYCIEVLEKEVETLKDKSLVINEEFNNLSEKDAPPVGDDDVRRLEGVVEDLQAEVESKSIENDLLKTVSEFASEIFKGETYEDLSLLMFETLTAMEVNTVLKIYSPSRTFEVCAAGKIPHRLATVIDNLQVNETNMGSSSFFFKYKNFGGAINPTRTAKLKEVQIEHVLMVTGIANKMFDNIRLRQNSKAQLQKLDGCENSIKQSFSDIDSALEKINKNSRTVIESGFRQVQEVARRSGMTAAHVAKIKSLEASALEDLSSENATRLKVKKSFLEVLKKLESIRY